MKRNSYAATHFGECQLCGHEQKLPGGGLLSLHGYSVRWNSFVGTCPGSRNQPYEKSCDLLAAEILRQRDECARLAEWAGKITAPSNKNVWVRERVPANRYGASSSSVWRELQPSEYKIVEVKYSDWSHRKLVWTTLQRGDAKPAHEEIGNHDDKTIAGLRSRLNESRAKQILAEIARRTEYCQWLQERIDGFKVRDLKPVPVEEQGSKQIAVHGLGVYWSKYLGRNVAACESSARASKPGQADWSKVTCKACLKVKAAQDADKVISDKANALIAEMVAKHGESVKVQFSDAASAAVKELRYQRKDLDKAVRKLACDRIERGVK